jgi:hypothetical protein
VPADAFRHEYDWKVAGSKLGVAGQNPHLTGGDKTSPPPSNARTPTAWAEPVGMAGSHIRSLAAHATS